MLILKTANGIGLCFLFMTMLHVKPKDKRCQMPLFPKSPVALLIAR